MGIRTTCNKQTSEPRKKLTKLRSVKVASLNRSRLSLKRKKPILAEQGSSQKTSKQAQVGSIGKLGESPNYMKATSCSYAKRGSLQPIPGDDVKRIYGLKRSRKMSTTRSRSRSRLPSSSTTSNVQLNAFHYKRRDFEDSIVLTNDVEASIQQTRSGSIKLNRMKSVKLPRRRWSKSRFDRASIAMTNDDEAPGEASSEAIMSASQPYDMDGKGSHSARRRWSESRFDQASIFMTDDDETTKKPNNGSEDASGMKPTRTLWKIPSLRNRRLLVKKQSKSHEVGNTQFDLSTCSSTIKSSMFPKLGLDSTAQVCTYTYCSIHGNVSASSAPLLEHKRGSLKKQKSRSRKRKSKTETACSMLETMNETVTGESWTELTKAASEEFNLSKVQCENSAATKKKYTNMWNLIYASHFLVRGNELTSEVSEKGRDEEGGIQVAESERQELNQAEAIEFVQQAVDEILLLDEQLSSQQPVNSNMADKNAEACRNTRDSLEKPLLDPAEGDLGEGDKSSVTRFPQRQRSNGFQRIRKVIATTKFIKAMEKLRPRRNLSSSEVHCGKETALLRHLSMDKRKDTEEWRLDNALQQVITKLDPAQRKRVANLVEAFERVTQDTNINRNPTKMLPAKEKRSITSDHANSRSSGNINPQIEYIEPIAPKGIQVEAMSIDHHAIVEEEPTKGAEEVVTYVQAPIQNPIGGCKFDNNVGKDTDFHFDKEKFSNVWQKVYQRVAASDMKRDTVRGNHLTRSKKHELKQADAVQLVQEAIDELLDLHDQQLSDQKSSEQCKAPEQEKMVGEAEPCSEMRDTVMMKTSKSYKKLWKMVGSTKFIKAMDKSREEWLLDYALQEVVTKLAPAQQKKVAMLTQAFDSFSSEQPKKSKKCFTEKMQPAYGIALANTKDHGQHKSEDYIQKPDDEVLIAIEDGLAFQQDSGSESSDTDLDMELYDDNSELTGVNLHIHIQGSPKGCPVCYPQSNFNI